MEIPANNRQLKLLRFFGECIPDRVSDAEARRRISEIWKQPGQKDRWNQYVFLTNDLTSHSPLLSPYDPSVLDAVQLPSGWTALGAEEDWREGLASLLLQTVNGFDDPPPEVAFDGRIFFFTGKFAFGEQADCQQAVVCRGGLVADRKQMPTHVVDFLVVGSHGSPDWKHGDRGNKISAAVVERHFHGKPAIIAEDHWRSYLG